MPRMSNCGQRRQSDVIGSLAVAKQNPEQRKRFHEGLEHGLDDPFYG